MSEVTIVRANPSLIAEQSEKLAKLIYSSGPVAFDYVFGDGEGFLQYSVVKGRSQFGYQNHYVALIDGNIVGSVACFDRQQLLKLEVGCILDMLNYCRWRFPVAAKRGLAFERICPKPAKNTLYLAHLGVDSEFQGKGIGQQLMEFVNDQARDKGYQSVTLDVAHSNPRAEQLYLRKGFELIDTRESNTDPIVGHNRLQKSLGFRL
ncbi:GNAT family N-acetyltransferase [Thalassotalea sp. PS06]|uniref:GNAT family N-acetyltransferase n=1 Tax=Thalassotalea sp. PS06 TaxID=2594005 RepID=UPI001164EE69|nr:GNAT family N-acetyltransferase [Thalassotalea sp. PS06]QDP00411.1 GNAT family N-acetyltransferase [Thalassotalea sp. PS06]